MNEKTIDCSEVLQLLKPGFDAVVKANPSLPVILRGADIDVFSSAPYVLLQRLPELVGIENVLEITVSQKSSTHWHIDFLDTELILRVDLYSGFPNYRRFSVNPGLFHRVVESSATPNSEGAPWPAAGRFYEAFIRYCEYLEFFWIGPEKHHHLDWILDNLSDKERFQLFEFAHQFLEVRSDLLKEEGLRKSWLRAGVARTILVAQRVPGLETVLRFALKNSNLMRKISDYGRAN